MSTKPPATKFFVEIIEIATRKPEKTLGPYDTRRVAGRAEDGVNRNLDHKRFFTHVTEKSV